MDGPLPASEFQARYCRTARSVVALTLLHPPPLLSPADLHVARRDAGRAGRPGPGAPAGGKQSVRVSRSLFTSLTRRPRQAVPPARDRLGARLSFSLVYPDRRGKPTMRPVGYVLGQSARGGGEDAGKTLHGVRFQTGDFLDVAILEHRT